MSSVIALCEYRRKKALEDLSLVRTGPERTEKPDLVGAEIWGRDYSELEAVVFGLLKVREIVLYYIGYDQDLESLLLCVLEAAYGYAAHGPDRLRAATMPLKEAVLARADEDNRRPLAMAVVILDLIEKTPGFKRP
ncbi:MAG: hypothetical protein PHV85_02845 [Desulfovibrionaceae bacterium]|nr:hypothetical protein [Desulfovibrionaceae bacterium]MDD4951468.1 hypothetical protein [Desulfovibrionaceae bacterium]